MRSIFSVPWDQLELEHVQRFLDAADEEGLTWEAKADEPPRGNRAIERVRPAQLAKAGCALTNQIGGYVIVGARRPRSGSWELPGIEPRGDEPRTWISQIMNDNLRPIPRFDVRTWTNDDGRWVIVVQVQPVDEAPCMTIQGSVFERVSSESFEQWALGLLASLTKAPPEWTGRQVTQSAVAIIGHTFEPLGPDEPFSTPWYERVPRLTRVLRASWDGAVALSTSFTSRALREGVQFDELLTSSWLAIDDLVRELGGFGPGQLATTVRIGNPNWATLINDQPDVPPEGSLFAQLREGDVDMARAVTVGDVDVDVVRSLEREFRRAAGEAVYEPPRVDRRDRSDAE
jgi:hypothetical protein